MSLTWGCWSWGGISDREVALLSPHGWRICSMVCLTKKCFLIFILIIDQIDFPPHFSPRGRFVPSLAETERPPHCITFICHNDCLCSLTPSLLFDVRKTESPAHHPSLRNNEGIGFAVLMVWPTEQPPGVPFYRRKKTLTLFLYKLIHGSSMSPERIQLTSLYI